MSLSLSLPMQIVFLFLQKTTLGSAGEKPLVLRSSTVGRGGGCCGGSGGGGGGSGMAVVAGDVKNHRTPLPH